MLRTIPARDKPSGGIAIPKSARRTCRQVSYHTNKPECQRTIGPSRGFLIIMPPAAFPRHVMLSLSKHLRPFGYAQGDGMGQSKDPGVDGRRTGSRWYNCLDETIPRLLSGGVAVGAAGAVLRRAAVRPSLRGARPHTHSPRGRAASRSRLHRPGRARPRPPAGAGRPARRGGAAGPRRGLRGHHERGDGPRRRDERSCISSHLPSSTCRFRPRRGCAPKRRHRPTSRRGRSPSPCIPAMRARTPQGGLQSLSCGSTLRKRNRTWRAHAPAGAPTRDERVDSPSRFCESRRLCGWNGGLE